ncbi:hypothetical protein V9L13_05435 [Pseudomonas sp. RSB 5.4]|uniref:hypothetical protein n=1 Tax=Pseudomonas sp. RSB 5.4 TaxID=3127459 RepID=UPI0030D56216
MKNKVEVKRNERTTGTFKIEIVGGLTEFVHDQISFDKNNQRIQIFAYEGATGGTMRPRKRLTFEFAPGTPTGHYDVKNILEASLVDYSDMHSFKYIPESGWISIVFHESPQRAYGLFTMKMKNIGEPHGPANIEVFGNFDLINQ